MADPPGKHGIKELDIVTDQARLARQSLAWADEAARAGDYNDALKWLDVVEAVGTDLSPAYRTKRDMWRRAARPPRVAQQPRT